MIENITFADFLGFIILGYLLAYLIGYSLNGLFSMIKYTR